MREDGKSSVAGVSHLESGRLPEWGGFLAESLDWVVSQGCLDDIS